MKPLGSVCLGIACIALLVVPSASAHKLTTRKAKAALTPVAAEMAPQMATKVVPIIPGATLTGTSVFGCKSTRGHRVDCWLEFLFAATGLPPENVLSCSRSASVRFRSKRSNKLKVSVDPLRLFCDFSVPLFDT